MLLLIAMLSNHLWHRCRNVSFCIARRRHFALIFCYCLPVVLPVQYLHFAFDFSKALVGYTLLINHPLVVYSLVLLVTTGKVEDIRDLHRCSLPLINSHSIIHHLSRCALQYSVGIQEMACYDFMFQCMTALCLVQTASLVLKGCCLQSGCYNL